MIRVYPTVLTTDASGDGTATVSLLGAAQQLAYAVEWIDGSLADGVDAVFSYTGNASGVDVTFLTLTNANDDKWYYVREAEDDVTGTELTTYTLPLVQGTLQCIVSSGGSVKVGSAYIYTVTV